MKSQLNNDLLCHYREASLAEKLQLCLIPEIREAMRKHLTHYDYCGRFRRVSREKLNEALRELEQIETAPKPFLLSMETFSFPFEFWNELRETACKLPPEHVCFWTASMERACAFRNEIIELSAYLVGKNRRLHFRLDEDQRDDADGNGFIGLLKAIDNYRPREGSTFESYAQIYIVNQILCSLRQDKLVKSSDSMRRFHRQYDLAVESLRSELNREPFPAEVAKALEMDVEEVFEKQERRISTMSMDADTGDEDASTMHDTLGQEAALPYEKIENHLIVDRLVEAMKGLTPAETSIVSLRWTPFQTIPISGPVLPAPEAFSTMRSRSLRILQAALVEEGETFP